MTERINEKKVREYLAQMRILIVDRSSGNRAAVARTLARLGALSSQMKLAQDFSEASVGVNRTQPILVVADYEINGQTALELVREFRRDRESDINVKKSVFVLLTSNSSQKAVAEAAEEDVDTFVVKPFSPKTLRQALVEVLSEKIAPTPYRLMIQVGRENLENGKIVDAIDCFSKAKFLHEKPALALSFLGEALLKNKKTQEAEECFRQGIVTNEIHYRCLLNLYQLFLEQKRFEEAYAILRRIVLNHSSKPERIMTGVKLAIQTRKVEDIGDYFSIYVNSQIRNQEASNTLRAALLVGGRYYLKANNIDAAMDYLKKACMAADNRPTVIREVCIMLADFKKFKESSEFLKRYPLTKNNVLDYRALEYQIIDREGDLSAIIQKGRDMMNSNIRHPEITQILVKRSIEAGFLDYAQSMLSDGLKSFPEQKSEFIGVAKMLRDRILSESQKQTFNGQKI